MNNHKQSFEWKQYFPHAKPREEQVEAINFALHAFYNSNKKYVIVEAGTGVGKSAVGLTVAKYIAATMMSTDAHTSGAYFLTTQKILQDQYTKDFSSTPGGMYSIKSSSNYSCKFVKGNSCAESLQSIRGVDKKSPFFKACTFNCNYRKAKDEFLKSKAGVTNFPYFLAETSYSGKITPRELLVVDEAHNTAEELSKFVEVTLSERFSKQVLKVEMPVINTQLQALNWVKDIYSVKLFSHTRHIEKMLGKYADLRDKIQEFAGLAKQFDMLDKHTCKLRRFLELYEKDNWVVNVIPADGRSGRKIEFKPIDVAPYAEPMLFRLGNKILCMSATILNVDAHCKMLGIPRDECEFISIPSPFPVKNRPIITCGIGSMSAKQIDNTLPQLVKAVKEILRAHPKEKGIIHCHTFKIANYIKRNIRSNRLLAHDSTNREETLRKHLRASSPTVLLSPSMTEGVDLVDDASRFQIICKVPYPYLGDKLIRKKMNKWPWWYSLITAKTIVQATGRSIRNKDDTAVTYILDGDWDMFYSKNTRIFPRGFRDCIT